MPREITAGEFTAESLEKEAASLPASMKAQADILRNAANIYREHGSKLSQNRHGEGPSRPAHAQDGRRLSG
jgi:hypothetical protein